MNRSTFWMIKYMNGSIFSKARYMNGVGFEILTRTPVPKLPLSYTPEACRTILFHEKIIIIIANLSAILDIYTYKVKVEFLEKILDAHLGKAHNALR